MLSSSPLLAQFKLIKKTALPEPVTYATVDRPGDLYLLSKKSLQKIDTAGNIILAAQQYFNYTLFEPRDGARLFAYDGPHKKYAFITPALTLLDEEHPLNEGWAIEPWMTCTSGDYDLIILDSADFTLKKISLKTLAVRWEASVKEHLHPKSNVLLMREYQNFIFILDKTQGILIFNSVGKFVRKVGEPNLVTFNFLGEELYYTQGNQMKLIDLFTTENRKITLPSDADFALLTDERLYIVQFPIVSTYKLDH